MNRRQYLLLLVVLVILLIFQRQLVTHLKIALFITEQFPQIPLKPLGLLTSNPEHKKVELETNNGKAVADLYIPNQILRLPLVAQDKAAALILAMGVKTSEDDKPILLHFADTMARLGYVTFWPRLEVLDKGESLPEEIETFIEAFKYLEENPSTHSINTQGRTEQSRSTTSHFGRELSAERLRVDKSRISFVGFSVGSSTSFVASADPQIRNKVHGLVFFGGYFDIFEYLLALDRQTSWQPHLDAVNHAKTLLVAKGMATPSANLAQNKDADRLKKYSPKEFVSDFKAKIFILHDKSDTYVPYTQSIKLYEAISKDQIGAYHISDLFEHVQPNRPINIGELVKLYGFLYQTLSFL